MLEYVVRLGWRIEFTFDDGQSALTFAQLAAEKRGSGPKYDDDDDGWVTITIRRKKEKIEEESEDV